jgi:hypothetical protein
LQKRRGEEASFGRLLSRLRVNPRAASDGGAWKDAPPLFLHPENFLDTVPDGRWQSL